MMFPCLNPDTKEGQALGRWAQCRALACTWEAPAQPRHPWRLGWPVPLARGCGAPLFCALLSLRTEPPVLPHHHPAHPGKGSRAFPRPGGRGRGEGEALRPAGGGLSRSGSERPGDRAWLTWMDSPCPGLPLASPASLSSSSWEAVPWASPAWCSGAFFTKVVDLGASSLKLEIWDTAGQEKYRSVCHLYFRGASAALLVYDITRKDSFHKAQQWLADLEKELHPGEVVVMLVGNKTDLGAQREVTFQEGKEFAESNRLLFMETSAKLNLQVSEVFCAVAQELLRREVRQSHSPQGDPAVVLKEGPARQAKCCAR